MRSLSCSSDAQCCWTCNVHSDSHVLSCFNASMQRNNGGWYDGSGLEVFLPVQRCHVLVWPLPSLHGAMPTLKDANQGFTVLGTVAYRCMARGNAALQASSTAMHGAPPHDGDMRVSLGMLRPCIASGPALLQRGSLRNVTMPRFLILVVRRRYMLIMRMD